MKNNPYNPLDWKYLIPDIEAILEEMDRSPILSVGITPYTRIIPAFFLKNYSIYSTIRTSDVDVLEKFINIYVLEDKNRDLALRVHGTGYLVKNHFFQNSFRALSPTPYLMFYTLTEVLVEELQKLRFPFLGNDPSLCNQVKYKGSFRKLLGELGLSTPPSTTYKWQDFLKETFENLKNKFGNSFVLQRGDKETGGNEGTFFIHGEDDFKKSLEILSAGEFEEMVVTRFVGGQSVSMLGCTTMQGVLSGPLQLQFVDIKESLQGVPKNGIFFGNDLGFHPWSKAIEDKAQNIIENVGAHMYKGGYKGIFGIDFLYDENLNDIFAIECNPRFTGSLLLHSLSLLEAKVPPFEFFHLLTQLQIDAKFNFEKVNTALKLHSNFAHISFSPKDIERMRLPLLAGVYNFDREKENLVYKGEGISLADLKNKNDFILIDTVPQLDKPIERGVPRLFKLIFPYSIAKSSSEIEDRAAFLVDKFASALIKADQEYRR
ncbi:MAG TPA: ATP-grasp domain-containing protein [Candidatus Paceibacterota bacterium]